MRSGVALVMLAVVTACSSPPGKGQTAGPEPVPGRAASTEAITYSTGACLGFCPVFSVTVTPTGGTFDGGAFTARSGKHRFALTPEQYRRFADTLEPFRPQGDRSIVDSDSGCGQAHTDDSSVTVSWGGKDRLSLYYGCENPELTKMKETLRSATDLLPIADLIGRR